MRYNKRGISLREKLEAGSTPEPNTGCWLWFKGIEGSGYPQVTHNGKHLHGNRASWMAYRGPIPDGMCVLHACDVRCCVNPDHLFLGTKRDNAIDMVRKGRANRAKGERHSGSKVTDKDVGDIRRSSLSLRILARQYNVSPSTISCIRKGRTWRHLNEGV